MTSDDALGQAKQGDVICVAEVPWVLVSRTCDLVRRSQIAWAQAVHAPDDKNADKGRRPHLAPVQAYEDGHWYADLSTLEHQPRDVVLQHCDTLQVGLETGTDAMAFRRHVGRYLSKPSWESYVQDTVEPVTKLAEKRHDKDSPEGQVYRALSDIRLELETTSDPGPRDHDTPRGLKIHYLVKTEEGAGINPDVVSALPPDDKAWLAEQDPPLDAVAERWASADDEDVRAAWLLTYCERLTGTCEPVSPIVEVTHSVDTEDQFTFQQVKRSSPIEVEYLSYRDDAAD